MNCGKHSNFSAIEGLACSTYWAWGKVLEGWASMYRRLSCTAILASLRGATSLTARLMRLGQALIWPRSSISTMRDEQKEEKYAENIIAERGKKMTLGNSSN